MATTGEPPSEPGKPQLGLRGQVRDLQAHAQRHRVGRAKHQAGHRTAVACLDPAQGRQWFACEFAGRFADDPDLHGLHLSPCVVALQLQQPRSS